MTWLAIPQAVRPELKPAVVANSQGMATECQFVLSVRVVFVQGAAVCCSVLQVRFSSFCVVAECCRVLQCGAVSVLGVLLQSGAM